MSDIICVPPEQRGGQKRGPDEDGREWMRRGRGKGEAGGGGGGGGLTDGQIDSWRMTDLRRAGGMGGIEDGRMGGIEDGRMRGMRSKTDRDRGEAAAGGWWKIPPGDLA